MTAPNGDRTTFEDLTTRIESAAPKSRRAFLTRSATLGGSALALAFAGSNTALAQADDDVNVDDATDVEVLQFALTLEHLENAFYRDVGGQFEEQDYRSAASLRGFGDRIRGDVVENLIDIGAHEQTHVDVLTDVITDLGEDPVQEAAYNFGVSDVDEFLEIARILENTGVTAYTGSIGDVESTPLKTAGATIATVEARHAAYLNLLTDNDPFPAAFDTPATRADVLDAAGQFFE